MSLLLPQDSFAFPSSAEGPEIPDTPAHTCSCLSALELTISPAVTNPLRHTCPPPQACSTAAWASQVPGAWQPHLPDAIHPSSVWPLSLPTSQTSYCVPPSQGQALPASTVRLGKASGPAGEGVLSPGQPRAWGAQEGWAKRRLESKVP